MSSALLDASALLALLNQEPGAAPVADAIANGATISAVNLSEVVARLAEAGLPEALVHETIDPLGLEVVAFDTVLAYEAGLLRPATRHAGLSLGDRACLALARRLNLPALTTDRAWVGLLGDVDVQLVR